MTTLYIAYFQEDEPYFGARDPRLWEERIAYRGPLTIVFKETDLLDSDPARGRLLLQQDDGTYKWVGPYAPHSPFAFNIEDAVQMLRWNNMGLNKHPSCWQGPKGMDEYHEIKAWHDSRLAVCEQWLAENKIELLKPFWQGGPGRRVWA